MIGSKWPRRASQRQRVVGAGLAVAGGFLVIRAFPLWMWPVGMGLWLLWAGLGPLLVGGGMVWLGWRLLRQA